MSLIPKIFGVPKTPNCPSIVWAKTARIVMLSQCKPPRLVMYPPTRRQILEALNKSELLFLARTHCLADGGLKNRNDLIDRLCRTRRANKFDLVRSLPLETLRKVCKCCGIDHRASKQLIESRLCGDQMGEAKLLVTRSLRRQGYHVISNEIRPPTLDTKDKIREVHQLAVEHKREVAKVSLARHESKLLKFIANGSEVSPERLCPRIEIVERGTSSELLFRYASVHWSIPVSSGYGRRLRALIFDDYNDKLIGLIGLCDPVYALKPRDRWINWTANRKSVAIRHIVDAYVLGAVPPYNQLLCGKLVALLACSSEIQQAFTSKYYNRKSLIRNAAHDGTLAAITTTSALGRSSVYNRLRLGGKLVYHPLGYTVGTGDFQFLNGTYDLIRSISNDCGVATAKHKDWGTGYRNRREVVQKFLKAAGISSSALTHGIKRQV